MADIQRFLNLVTSEHANRPKFIAWLTEHLSLVDDAATLANDLYAYFDTDNAIGTQLDIIGQIVGVDRTVSYQPIDGSSPILSDDTYRTLIKAKILKNSWDGTIPSIISLWKNMFPQFGIQVIDNQNMSMTAVLTGQINSATQQLIDNSYIVPKPEGVLLNIEYLSSSSMSPYVGMAITTDDGITVPMINPDFAGNSIANMSEVLGLIPSVFDITTINMKQP